MAEGSIEEIGLSSGLNKEIDIARKIIRLITKDHNGNSFGEPIIKLVHRDIEIKYEPGEISMGISGKKIARTIQIHIDNENVNVSVNWDGERKRKYIISEYDVDELASRVEYFVYIYGDESTNECRNALHELHQRRDMNKKCVEIAKGLYEDLDFRMFGDPEIIALDNGGVRMNFVQDEMCIIINPGNIEYNTYTSFTSYSFSDQSEINRIHDEIINIASRIDRRATHSSDKN